MTKSSTLITGHLKKCRKKIGKSVIFFSKKLDFCRKVQKRTVHQINSYPVVKNNKHSMQWILSGGFNFI